MNLVSQIKRKIRKRPPGVRAGQAAFNALAELHPELADLISGLRGIDPFHDDQYLPEFYAFIESSSLGING